jgi:hypothetical protein
MTNNSKNNSYTTTAKRMPKLTLQLQNLQTVHNRESAISTDKGSRYQSFHVTTETATGKEIQFSKFQETLQSISCKSISPLSVF